MRFACFPTHALQIGQNCRSARWTSPDTSGARCVRSCTVNTVDATVARIEAPATGSTYNPSPDGRKAKRVAQARRATPHWMAARFRHNSDRWTPANGTIRATMKRTANGTTGLLSAVEKSFIQPTRGAITKATSNMIDASDAMTKRGGDDRDDATFMARRYQRDQEQPPRLPADTSLDTERIWDVLRYCCP